MEQLIARVNKLPIAVRAAILGGLVIVITGACFFFIIQDVESQIDSLKGQAASLDKTFAEKKEIADNLKERRREMDQMEQRLQDALTELPERKDIDDLLSQLNDHAKKSGLDIARVSPGGEALEGFYARIPVAMSVSGNYHEVAMFFQEVANMRRIVNISNIKLGSPLPRNDKIILAAEFMATTFRFHDPAAAAAAKGKKK